MIKANKGVITVEAALGLPVLLMVLFTWLDLSVLTYSMSFIDHAFTTAVMKNKKLGDSSNSVNVDYQKTLLASLNESGGLLGKAIVNQASVSTNVYYFKNIDTFTACNILDVQLSSCADAFGDKAENSINMPIAAYQLTFEYNPLFNYALPNIDIKREIIAVQEYERCSFKLGKGAGCGH